MRAVDFQEKASLEEYKRFIREHWESCIAVGEERWRQFRDAAMGERREEMIEKALLKFEDGWMEHGELIAGQLDTESADEEENIDKVNYAAIHLHDNG